jgi:hypothetical protein
MSDRTPKIPQVSRQIERSNVAALDTQTEADSSPAQNRIPLTVRIRHKVMRVAPPIDDGFRPFRVF